jgi:hypothetical protein
LTAFICDVVEDLDAGERHAELDRLHDGVDRAASVSKLQTAAEMASGMPCRRSVTSVMMPSVPSAPIISRVRS